ncbi:MAG: tetratricopeptide repeat protein [Planctomycetaceae bacterium]|nr:tetratricopeptide repeat protein [Planctomycetaceae bacterium]
MRRTLLGLGVLCGLTVAAYVVWLANRTPRADYHAIFRDGLQALEAHDLPRVGRALERLQAAPEFDREYWLLHGGKLLQEGNYSVALQSLKLTRPVGELQEPALRMTAQCLFQVGRVAEAESVFKQLLQVDPDHPDAHRGLAVIYYDVGAMDHALTHLAELARVDPDDYAPHRLAGRIHLDFQRYAEAAEAYRLCLERAPPPEVRREATVNRGRALLQLREYQPALELLQPLTDDPEALALSAESHWALGESEAARTLLQQALQLAPNGRTARYLSAQMHLSDNHADDAADDLEVILAADPHDYEARHLLAQAYQQLGREADAAAARDQMQADFALFERMTELSRKAINAPDNPFVRDELADVCEQLGKTDLAEVWRNAATAVRQKQGVQVQLPR